MYTKDLDNVASMAKHDFALAATRAQSRFNIDQSGLPQMMKPAVPMPGSPDAIMAMAKKAAINFQPTQQLGNEHPSIGNDIILIQNGNYRPEIIDTQKIETGQQPITAIEAGLPLMMKPVVPMPGSPGTIMAMAKKAAINFQPTQQLGNDHPCISNDIFLIQNANYRLEIIDTQKIETGQEITRVLKILK